jgi:hypothetical protein
LSSCKKNNEYLALYELDQIDRDLWIVNTSPQKRDYKLEQILQKIFEYNNLKVAEPFKIKEQQIDDSVKLEGENYLVEAKW